MFLFVFPGLVSAQRMKWLFYRLIRYIKASPRLTSSTRHAYPLHKKARCGSTGALEFVLNQTVDIKVDKSP